MNERLAFKGKCVLVVGGAGSIGSVVVKQLLATDAAAIRVFDNDEYGLFILNFELEKHRDQAHEQRTKERIRLLIGDIRDRERAEMALRGVDYVVHLSALKNIAQTEYNVPETIRTNVVGTMNLVELCMTHSSVSKALLVSSDKACNPTSLYGQTKAIGEHLFRWANRVMSPAMLFSATRFGNVYEARGNVFDVWNRQRASNRPLTVTHLDAKRYFWHVEDAARFILMALETMRGGEVFVPAEMEERKIRELIGSTGQYELVGLRRNEKLREELMTAEEGERAIRRDGCWIIPDSP